MEAERASQKRGADRRRWRSVAGDVGHGGHPLGASTELRARGSRAAWMCTTEGIARLTSGAPARTLIRCPPRARAWRIGAPARPCEEADIRREIEAALAPLVGLPLTAASRVVDMATFGFGAMPAAGPARPASVPPTACTSRRSGGSPWRARSSSGTATTSFRPATHGSHAGTSSPGTPHGRGATTSSTTGSPTIPTAPTSSASRARDAGGRPGDHVRRRLRPRDVRDVRVHGRRRQRRVLAPHPAPGDRRGARHRDGARRRGPGPPGRSRVSPRTGRAGRRSARPPGRAQERLEVRQRDLVARRPSRSGSP